VLSTKKLIFQWILIPMVVIILIDSSFLFYQGDKLRQETFDKDLAETAKTLAIIFKKTSSKEIHDIDPNTISLLLTEPHDEMFYAIRDSKGQFIFGNPKVPYQEADAEDLAEKDFLNVFSDEIDGKGVRVVSIPIEHTIRNKMATYHIQLAETRLQRQEIQRQIIFWIVIPQLILLISAMFLVRFAVTRGLSPILFLNEKITSLSYKNLTPIDLQGVPKEVDRLVGSLNKLMQELNLAIQSQNRFVSDAAHQLRTPLAGILAQIELALDTKDANEIQKRLENINESSKRLIHIINQLLTLSKSQSDMLHHAEFMPLDLVAFTKKVTSIMLPAADLKHIDLGYEGSEEVLNIMANEVSLYDLIHNLIDNAIKYTADHGKITLAVDLKDSKARLTVEDNGIGISKEDQTMIYERFYRGDNVNTAGAGVGLAIVKEIADIHNARIEIDSRQDKKGTCFYVYFDAIAPK
jgi:two-component system sensor histidine kinase TctE